MNRQEVFDKVAVHLLTQNKRSTQELGGVNSCRYRTSDGCRCAIGALIADEHYSESLEGHQVSHICVRVALSFSGFIITNVAQRFLEQLQGAHDNFPPRRWRRLFIALARENGLSAEVVENFEAKK